MIPMYARTWQGKTRAGRRAGGDAAASGGTSCSGSSLHLRLVFMGMNELSRDGSDKTQNT